MDGRGLLRCFAGFFVGVLAKFWGVVGGCLLVVVVVGGCLLVVVVVGGCLLVVVVVVDVVVVG